MFKYQILAFLENEGLIYTVNIRQLETSLDANVRCRIWKLQTQTPQG